MEFNTNTGDCFISNQTLATQFGVSEKTISRSVANLEGRGFIKRNTKNVQKGKERHMIADLAKIEAATKDKMTLASNSSESTKDKMTIAEETKCPLRNGQNDSIKDNTNKIKLKDKEEIDELPSATLQADSSIS
jgi:DeoR/GlpR family transcriptional regulator of sugar metabolism